VEVYLVDVERVNRGGDAYIFSCFQDILFILLCGAFLNLSIPKNLPKLYAIWIQESNIYSLFCRKYNYFSTNARIIVQCDPAPQITLNEAPSRIS